jgi:hypothetical protein
MIVIINTNDIYFGCYDDCDDFDSHYICLPTHPFVLFLQVTALGAPNLLEKISTALVAKGGALDRGHCSRDLRSALGGSLSAAELASFDRMWDRLNAIAGACHIKVGPPHPKIGESRLVPCMTVCA